MLPAHMDEDEEEKERRHCWRLAHYVPITSVGSALPAADDDTALVLESGARPAMRFEVRFPDAAQRDEWCEAIVAQKRLWAERLSSLSPAASAAARDSGGPGVLKDGYLTKEGGIFPSWKKRWFVLDSTGALSYYDDRGAGHLLRTIRVDMYNVRVSPRSDRDHVFELYLPGVSSRVYVLSAAHSWERDAWINAIYPFTPDGVVKMLETHERAALEQLETTVFPDNQPLPKVQSARLPNVRQSWTSYPELGVSDDQREKFRRKHLSGMSSSTDRINNHLQQ